MQKISRKAAKLDAPPLPGEKNVYLHKLLKKAWEAWIELQTMLINENHLDLSDKSNRRWLNEQMELFWAIKTINDPQIHSRIISLRL